MTTRRILVWAAVGLVLAAVSCSDLPSPSGSTPPSTAAPPSAAPAPAPSPSAPSATSCRHGNGTLDTTCARLAEVFEADVNRAIDRLAEVHPEIFDTSSARGPGEWGVRRQPEYLAGVVAELQQRRFCAETDTVASVSLKNSSAFSETYDILHPTGHVRRGNRAYQHTCRPPSFPVDPREAIAYVRVAFYSITCEAGIAAPRNGENLLPVGCRGFVTATPKQRNNEDVPHHIVTEVSWRLDQTGGVVAVHDDPNNRFNKTVVPLDPGRYSLCATVHGVEGCQHAEVVPDPRR